VQSERSNARSERPCDRRRDFKLNEGKCYWS
jgi:hypothetical protein